MRNKNVVLMAIALATSLASGASFAAVSGSQLFQIGAETAVAAVSGNALSFTVPVAGGGTSTVSIAPGQPAQAAISQIGGAYSGPGTYVITDSTGTTVSIVVDGSGNVVSVTEGDITKQ